MISLMHMGIFAFPRKEWAEVKRADCCAEPDDGVARPSVKAAVRWVLIVSMALL